MFEIIILIAFGYVLWAFVKNKNTEQINPQKPSIKDGVKEKRINIQKSGDTYENALISLNTKEPSRIKVKHKKQEFLATRNEQKLYFALQKALPPEYVIHSQVSLMALVQPVNFKDNSRTWAKRMDFVITDKATKVLAVIELDDSTHNWKKRQERDQYVNDVLEGHHPLIRFNTKSFYEPSEVAEALSLKTEIRCNIFE